MYLTQDTSRVEISEREKITYKKRKAAETRTNTETLQGISNIDVVKSGEKSKA